MTLDLRRPVPVADPELLRQIGTIAPSQFGHLLVDGFFPELHRIAGSGRMCGRVVTVRLDTADSLVVHYLTTLIEPGDVVVISCVHPDFAPLGGIVAASLAASGAIGVVVDGFCTDLEGLHESGLTVFARGLTARTTRRSDDTPTGGMNVTVRIAGRSVDPGQIALADDDGLLIAAPNTYRGVLDRALELEIDEDAIMTRIRGGESFGTFFLEPDTLALLDEALQEGSTR